MNDAEERYRQAKADERRHTRNALYWSLFSVICAFVSLAATLYKVLK